MVKRCNRLWCSRLIGEGLTCGRRNWKTARSHAHSVDPLQLEVPVANKMRTKMMKDMVMLKDLCWTRKIDEIGRRIEETRRGKVVIAQEENQGRWDPQVTRPEWRMKNEEKDSRSRMTDRKSKVQGHLRAVLEKGIIFDNMITKKALSSAKKVTTNQHNSRIKLDWFSPCCWTFSSFLEAKGGFCNQAKEGREMEREATDPFLSLPNELCIEIMSLLIDDLSFFTQSVAVVCSRWAQLASSRECDCINNYNWILSLDTIWKKIARRRFGSMLRWIDRDINDPDLKSVVKDSLSSARASWTNGFYVINQLKGHKDFIRFAHFLSSILLSLQLGV